MTDDIKSWSREELESAYVQRELQLAKAIAKNTQLKAKVAKLEAVLNCDHKQYDRTKHGRYCPCGTQMWDAGD